ncbi:head-tail connector protein [Rhizobiaceae bacterium n13]|uniref:Head-tail connector protein n=1 Tax=Ferirhizobium litorale TaxID=2927786 RepID=A0AAE3QCM6_9HYPH|nr:head-tail connector protein [Fererhizobium litorale]MDI7861266.1 head-tail connector protein [Fererhizobium litorale]MDI7921413.1 head-tail connector protein [Fererhizobium litorale]
MTYATIRPPLAEPLTLAEAKAHLRLDGSDEDDLLLPLVKAAREHLERLSGLCLMTQALRLYRDDWPADGVIQIARGPVQAIESVTVYDTGGEPVAVSLDGHRLDGASHPARLTLNQFVNSHAAINGIEIDFVAGFGDAATDVPDMLKRALTMHVAHMFEWRGAVSMAGQPAGVPAGYDRLVTPYLPARL